MIEADFQREYHIDLSKSLSDMSWRRFTILLQGLSKNSVFVTIASQEQQNHGDILDDNQAVALMNAIAK